TVYIDPDCKQPDCSDAKFAFVFDRMLPEDLEALYPEQGPWERHPLGIGPAELEHDDRVVVLEYFVREPREDKLVSFVGPDGKRAEMKKSQLENLTGHEGIMDAASTKVRSVPLMEVKRYFIVGDRALGEKGDEKD